MAYSIPNAPEGAGIGPRYGRRSPWMTTDGVDYHTANVVENDGPAGHKEWSDRGFADAYADNPAQAQGYRMSPPWRGSDYIQNEQRHYFTNPFPAIPWSKWPRYSANSTRRVDNLEGNTGDVNRPQQAEIQVGGAGIVQHQTSVHRAPDARWFDIPEAFQTLPNQSDSNVDGGQTTEDQRFDCNPVWRL